MGVVQILPFSQKISDTMKTILKTVFTNLYEIFRAVFTAFFLIIDND